MLNHPPYNAQDLKDPPLPGPEFIQLLHRQRAERYPDPPRSTSSSTAAR